MSDDLISRQAAIEAIETHAKNVLESYDYEWYTADVYGAAHRHIIEVLQKLPTAQERTRGNWIYKGKRGRFPVCECSVCGNAENADWAVLGENVNYCPNCGARMKGEEDG